MKKREVLDTKNLIGKDSVSKEKSIDGKVEYFLKEDDENRYKKTPVESRLSVGNKEKSDTIKPEEREKNKKIDSEQANYLASEFGKFDSVAQLLRAYNELEGEFTRRCQKLKEALDEVDNLKKSQANEGEIQALGKEKNDTKEIENQNEQETVFLTKENKGSSADEAISFCCQSDNEVSVVSAQISKATDKFDNGQQQSLVTESIDQNIQAVEDKNSYDKNLLEKESIKNSPSTQNDKSIVSGHSIENEDIKFITNEDFEDFLQRKLNDEEFLDSAIIYNPKVRAKIIESYLMALDGIRSANVLSGGFGKTVVQKPSRPKTLEEAKKLAEILMS